MGFDMMVLYHNFIENKKSTQKEALLIDMGK
jgi:hypothetical protein